LHGHNRLFRNQGRTHAGAPFSGYPEEIRHGVFRVILECVPKLQPPSVSVAEPSLSSAGGADQKHSLTHHFTYNQG
jgi:hypothetical protein